MSCSQETCDICNSPGFRRLVSNQVIGNYYITVCEDCLQMYQPPIPKYKAILDNESIKEM